MNTMPSQETSSTITRALTLPCQQGLHLRVAAVIVTMAKLFHSIISFVSGSQRADAKSILSLLRLGAVGKAPLVLTASGQDADRAIRGLGDPFESKRVLCKDAGQLAHARWEDG